MSRPTYLMANHCWVRHRSSIKLLSTLYYYILYRLQINDYTLTRCEFDIYFIFNLGWRAGSGKLRGQNYQVTNSCLQIPKSQFCDYPQLDRQYHNNKNTFYWERSVGRQHKRFFIDIWSSEKERLVATLILLCIIEVYCMWQIRSYVGLISIFHWISHNGESE